MMGWLRNMFRPHPTEVVRRPTPSPELAAARIRHRQLLSRADEAIKDAMDHADEMFGPAYRGPERRHR